MLEGNCIMQLNVQCLMISDGCREFSWVLFQLLELLETWKEDRKNNCSYKANEDGRIKSSWKVYLNYNKMLTDKSSQLSRYTMKSKISQHMVQRQLNRFVIFVCSSPFFPNANRCIMLELILACVPISFTFVCIFWMTYSCYPSSTVRSYDSKRYGNYAKFSAEYCTSTT